MIQETTEHMDEVVTTGEVTSTEPISLSTEPPKRDKPVADPETYCNLTSISDINNSLTAVGEYVDETNRIYIDPVTNSVRSTLQPWFQWGIDTADSWFVKPFDYRRKEENTLETKEQQEKEEEKGNVVYAKAVVEEGNDTSDQKLSGADMSSISTSIDVTGDRNDSGTHALKSSEI